jgi:hypothetical protein
MRRTILVFVASATTLATSALAAIPVGAGGTGTLTFDALPLVADGWSTLSVGASATAITNSSQLDAAVQLLTASSIITALGSSTTVPPSQNALARWNGGLFLLQTKPTGVDYTPLMATLVNNSGGNISTFGISYDFGATAPTDTTIQEDVPGLQAYFSLSGAAGSWQAITALSGGVSGLKQASVTLGTPWTQGSQAYLVWADDNGPAAGNVTTGNIEGGYTIDNFRLDPVPEPTTLGLLALGALALLLRRRVCR